MNGSEEKRADRVLLLETALRVWDGKRDGGFPVPLEVALDMAEEALARCGFDVRLVRPEDG